MPQSSRKRNKGKNRKSKKAENDKASANSLWTGWAFGKLDFIGKNIFCKHGFVVPEEIEHSIVTFMDDLTTHFVTSPKTVDMIKTSFETHPQIWNDDKYIRKLALDIMKSIGTNMLLRIKSAFNSPGTIEYADSEIVCPNFEGAFCWGNIIVAFERYERGSNDIDAAIYSKEVQIQFRNFDTRDVSKFYRKRASCSCIKELHLEIKKLEPKKMGTCWNCDKELERYLLMVCSRCMVTQYCSRKCQVAHWPEHKEELCDRIVNARK